MKTVLSSTRRHQVKRLGMSLIIVALITAIVSCDGGASCGCGGPTEWYLGVSSGEGGQVIVSGGPTFAPGTVVAIEAVADECYAFVNWTGDVADPYSPITTVTMDQAQNVTANFALLSYDLTVGSTDGGQVTAPGEGTLPYDCGTVVPLVAAAEGGYYFGNWSGDVDTIANINAPTTTITMKGNYSITANFELIPPGQFVLTTSSTAGGSVTDPGEGTFLYDEDTVADLVAVADECYEFVNWTGDVVADPDSATTTITMDGAKNVTANFALLSYDLTVGSTDGGQVSSPGEDTFPYDCGAVVDLVAEADQCYEFVNWTGDAVADPDSATTTITMDGAKNVTANFALLSLSYDLAVDSTDGGQVITPGEGIFSCDCGTVVDLVATPDAYYGFVRWTGDVGTIADINVAETTITMSGNYSITANFGLFAGGNGTAEDPYQIADWYHLDNVRNYLSSHFIVVNDLDSNSIGYTELASTTANGGEGWEPIGIVPYPFAGSLNGHGYEIRDMFIARPDESDTGLFGVVSGTGIVENVSVVNGNVTGYDNAGGLVGRNSGTVSNSYSSGNMTGSLNVGGLVGYNFFGNVTNAYSSGSVTGQNNNTGGLVGWNRGTISKSYVTGNVTGDLNVGGLAGKNSGTVSNSYATGSVTGYDNVGGLVGRNDIVASTVSKSYSTGNVTGTLHVGGLMGRNQGAVSNSFWDTQTSGQGSSAGGTGKTTAQMKDIDTFTSALWDIIAVGGSGERDPLYIWNIVDDVTYAFLSWQPV